MRIPIQSKSIVRVSDRGFPVVPMIEPQGCSTTKKIQCAGRIAAAAAVCSSGVFTLACAGALLNAKNKTCCDCLKTSFQRNKCNSL